MEHLRQRNSARPQPSRLARFGLLRGIVPAEVIRYQEEQEKRLRVVETMLRPEQGHLRRRLERRLLEIVRSERDIVSGG